MKHSSLNLNKFSDYIREHGIDAAMAKYHMRVLSHNSYKFNALFKKSTTFCICFQLELHFLLAHKKLLTFSIRSQLLLLFLRYIKK